VWRAGDAELRGNQRWIRAGGVQLWDPPPENDVRVTLGMQRAHVVTEGQIQRSKVVDLPMCVRAVPPARTKRRADRGGDCVVARALPGRRANPLC
jgi:hypothetical protein